MFLRLLALIVLLFLFLAADYLIDVPVSSQVMPAISKNTPTQVPLINDQEVLVTKVIDGDTIEIEGGKTIRYIGIDTPETKHPQKELQCFGKEASEKNRELIGGKKIRLEKDISETDRYGRLLRYVYINDVFINDYLVRQGYAFAATFPPDVKYQQQFSQAQQEARENKRGLWVTCKSR